VPLLTVYRWPAAVVVEEVVALSHLLIIKLLERIVLSKGASLKDILVKNAEVT
jgi:hypothetical protein